MSLRDELLGRFPRLRALPPGCFVVGGAVRDLHLGIDPADVDVAAPDPLAAAQRVRKRVIRLGSEEHLSAWRVVDGEHIYDFAAILDGDISADLARRDFTVNAMAVSLDDGSLLDPHAGRADLVGRVVRMIDPANFDDDPLRCLKAVRMVVKFGFEIDAATVAAIRARAALIHGVAGERITFEISVIFSAGAFRRAVRLLRETGLFEGGEYHADDVSFSGAMALLARDPRECAKKLRWSQELLRETLALQSLLNESDDLRIALYDAGERVARQLPAVLRALGRQADIAMPDFDIRPLLTGDEIAAIRGMQPGPQLGALKRSLLEAQIRGEVHSRDGAVAWILARRLE